jgi:hypothetical protein
VPQIRRLGAIVLVTLTCVLGASEAQAATARVSVLRMVALGDSYSAGVGVGAVGFGCDRDGLAYAPRARNDLLPASYRIDRFAFVACSGAKTSDVLATQLGAISSTDSVASITIGGNDIGFGPKISGCAFGSCGPDTYGLQADVRGGTQTWSGLFNKLVNVYVSIRRRMAATGHLYVLSYPIPFSRDSTSSCSGFTATEQNAANALVTRLDDTIYNATGRAAEVLRSQHGRPGNVRFVDWRTGTRITNGYTIPKGWPGAGQQFATFKSPDGLCNTRGRSAFINGYVAAFPAGGNLLGNSFHPKSNGYWKAATLLQASIRRYQP